MAGKQFGIAEIGRSTMKLAFSSGLLSMTLNATAAPCDGVDRTLTDERKAELVPAIASQLHINEVTILGSFRYLGWYIIHAETPTSDPPFLFFNGDPVDHRYVALWSGAAMVGEGPTIKHWVLKNAQGIPTALASCFSYRVMPK